MLPPADPPTFLGSTHEIAWPDATWIPIHLVEVEVRHIAELQEALALQVDRILLDNMTLDEMRTAVHLTEGRVPLEASGNVSLENVATVAATGVDYISIGMLTHSVCALDISLLLDTPLVAESHSNHH